MDAVIRRLAAGEPVTFRTRLHPVTFAGTAGFAAFVAGVTLLIVLRNELAGRTIALLALSAAVVIALAAAGPVLRWCTTAFAVTPHRLVVRSGLRGSGVLELPLGEVRRIDVEQSLGGRLLGYGTVLVVGKGVERAFARVAAAEALRKAVLGARERPRPAAGRGTAGSRGA